MYKFACIIGAQRSGTTYLFRLLDEHPEIVMAKPERPEPKFFLSDDYKRGLDFYLGKYFIDQHEGKKVIGEKGTSYIEYPEAALKIRALFRDPKILVILRNPVQRAISNYFFSVENGLESRSLSDVFIHKVAEPNGNYNTSVSPFNYLGRGHYLEYLLPYKKMYGENFKVIILEELLTDPSVFKSVYNFVGVDPDFIPPSLQMKVNSNEVVTDSQGEITEVVGLLTEYYRPHIAGLEKMMNRKLKLWQ